MNAGRAPTRIGGDGILPYVDVPHWLAADLSRVLRSHRVEFQVRVGYVRRVGSDDPDDHTDRFVFPTERAARVQVLVDSIVPPRRR